MRVFWNLFLFLLFSINNFCFGEKLINEDPILTIFGNSPQKKRPEGIAFSSNGKYLAIANSSGDSVEIFLQSEDGRYETEPSFVLSAAESGLNYPHDVAFSNNDRHLAVANRYKDNVFLFKRDKKSGFFEKKPFHVIAPKNGLKEVGAVAYSPTQRLLAIADTLNHAVLIYQYKKEQYDANPYCILSLPSLQCPDGLTFSQNGDYLAVTYHSSNAVAIFQKASLEYAPNIFHSEPMHIFKGEESLLNCPHSVAFHPTKDVLIISCAGGKDSVNVFHKRETGFSASPDQTLRTYNPETIHLQKDQPQEGGAKGVAISPDGKLLGVCNPDLECNQDIEREDRIYLYKFNH